MSPSCPISTRYIDSNIVRLISLQVAILSLVFIYTSNIIFAYILLVDYIARVLRIDSLSPFSLVSNSLVSILSLEKKMSNEAPKRFALHLGFSIAIVIVVGSLAEFSNLVLLSAIILFACSLIETLFNFCIGCKMYYMLQLGKYLYKKGDI